MKKVIQNQLHERSMSRTMLPTPTILLSFLTLLISYIPSLIAGQSTLSDKDILIGINQHWAVQSWESTTTPCNNWPGILCTGGITVTGITVKGQFIKDIPPNICDLKNLTLLDLGNNKIQGKFPTLLYNCSKLKKLVLSQNHFNGQLPNDINKFFPKLQHLDLSVNSFTGHIPLKLTNLVFLSTLVLANNRLSGEIPSRIRSWESLATLDLSGNELSGPLPVALGFLPSLKDLDLSDNRLSGLIPPELGLLDLITLDLSYNKFRGKIPYFLDQKKFKYSFVYSGKLCSETLDIDGMPECCSSCDLGFLILLFVASPILNFLSCYYINKVCKQGQANHSSEQQEWELKSFHRIDFTKTAIVSSLTDNNVIGSGGSGKVYIAVVNDSGDKVAVKRIWNGTILDKVLEKQFVAEVEILGTFRHANVVKLLCCVSSAQEKLLVYEYMENQSLDKWLRRKSRMAVNTTDTYTVLDWPTRLRIATGAAKGLCYLHNDCSPPIIHRDLKSSNILLDSEFNAKIADFGLAKMTNNTGESGISSTVVGSFGYIAPEYWQTKKPNEKIDIYSFGVVLLELTTGKHPCKGNDYLNLADWSWQHCCEEHFIIDALDKDIKEPRFMEQMVNVFKLGLMCTSKMPDSRPTMQLVLQLLIEWNHHEDLDQAKTIDEERVCRIPPQAEN